MVRVPWFLLCALIASAVSAATALGPERAVSPSSRTGAWIASIAAADPLLMSERYLSPSRNVAAPFFQSNVHVASSGDQSLAIWNDARRLNSNTALVGTRIAADGTALDPFGNFLDTIYGSSYGIAWNGSEYMIAHGTFSDVRISSVDRNGTMLRSRVPFAFMTDVRMAGDGREVAITGHEGNIATFRLVNRDGSPGTKSSFGDAFSRIVPVPTRYGWIVLFDKGSALNFCRVDGSLPTAILPLEDGAVPVVAAATDGADRMLIAWSWMVRVANSSSYRLRVRYAMATTNGFALMQPADLEDTPYLYGGDVSVAITPEPPAVAWDGQRFLIAWRWFDGDGNRELRAVRIEREGARVDAAPLVLDRARDPNYPSLLHPQIAVMNGGASLLWSSARGTLTFPRLDLVQRTMTSFDQLATSTAQPQVVAASAQLEREPALAAGDDAAFAAWREGDYGGQIIGRLLPYNGAERESFAISHAPSEAAAPAVASTGGVFLVAWREDQYAPPTFGQWKITSTRILARRYDRAGVALDPDPLLLAEEAGANIDSFYLYRTLSIAGDGHQFLVVWQSLEDSRVHGARVTTEGTRLDPAPIAISPDGFARRGAPHAFWTGSEFSVYWYEDPTQMPVEGAGATPMPHMARRASVSANGAVLGAASTAVTTPAVVDVRSPFDVVFNGSEVMMTWSLRPTSSSPSCVYSQRFTASGAPIDAQPVTLQCAQGGINEGNGEPHPVWDGANWWITFTNLGFGFGARTLQLSNGFPSRAALLLAFDTGRPVGAQSIATPVGLMFVWSRSDAASGNVQRLILRRLIISNRTRSARH